MENTKITPKKTLDAFHLKLIAIIAMLLNHIGSGFQIGLSHPWIYLFTETIGKLTFPIMAYLLVEGFYHTKNLKKYILRLALFWMLAIVPFHIYFFNNWNFTFLDLFNNVLFTLLVGLIMIILCEKTENSLLRFCIVIFSMFLTVVSDWSLVGVLIIFWYYNIKDEKKRIMMPSIYIALPFLLITVIAKVTDPSFSNIFFIEGVGMLGMFLTIPLLLKYNGNRGYSPKWVKYGYYLFYPLHLTVLYLIRYFI